MKTSAIFQNCLGRAAFIDHVAFNIWGDLRGSPLGAVTVENNVPIGGSSSKYARLLSASCPLTGNPINLAYGKRVRYVRVPPIKLAVHSETGPLTCAECLLVADALLCRGYLMQVSRAELTFDLSDETIGSFRRCAFTRARHFSELSDADGWATLYFGSPKSEWQLRVYQKTSEVVRAEFIFRRAFFRKQGVALAPEILQLRHVDLGSLVTLKRFKEGPLSVELDAVGSIWKRNLFHDWPEPLAWQELDSILRRGYGIETSTLLEETELARRLSQMQRRLVW